MLQEKRRPSVSDRLMGEINQGLQQRQQQQQMQQENQRLEQRFGQKFSNDPETRKLEIKYALEGENDLNKIAAQLQGKKNEGPSKEDIQRQDEISNLQGAMQSVQKMKQLRKKGNLGRGSSFFGYLGGDVATDRGTYETLGNSLIQYATNLKITNKQEFEKLAGHLSDPDVTDDEAKGILNALEKIINDNMMKYQTNKTGGQNQPSMNQTKKPPLASFER